MGLKSTCTAINLRPQKLIEVIHSLIYYYYKEHKQQLHLKSRIENKLPQNHPSLPSHQKIPTCLSVNNCNPPLIPKQNIQIPNKLQKKSKSVGLRLGYCCVKVEIAQIIRAAGQKMNPVSWQLQEQDPSLPRGDGVSVLQGYWVFGQQQSNRHDWLNCCEWKDLLSTKGPIPITGRKLKIQDRQQTMPQPGRHGGLLTTPSHLHMTQLVKKFLNSKQATRQQNSTSVTLANMVMPAKYPIRQNCTKDNNGLAQWSRILELRASRQEYKIRSRMGQPYIMTYSYPGFMFLITWLKMDGMRYEQKKQSTAMKKQGRKDERNEFRINGRLLIRVTTIVSRAVKAQNMYS